MQNTSAGSRKREAAGFVFLSNVCSADQDLNTRTGYMLGSLLRIQAQHLLIRGSYITEKDMFYCRVEHVLGRKYTPEHSSDTQVPQESTSLIPFSSILETVVPPFELQ